MDREDLAALGGEYAIEGQLGEGTYGVVFRARSTQTGALYAIKKLRLDGLSEGVPATAVREITLLQDLAPHPNIVKLLHVICRHHRLYLVFELMTEDLRKFIQRAAAMARPSGTQAWSAVPVPVVKHFTRQLLHALWYCHQNRIVHRDLKPGNVLVEDRGNGRTTTPPSSAATSSSSSSATAPPSSTRYHCKLADFGLARTFELPLVTYTNEVVTLWYRAPEILLGETHYTPAVDVWSVGCMVAEMLIGKALFRGDTQLDQLGRIFSICGTPTESTWQGVQLLRGYGALQQQLPQYPAKDVAQLFEFTGDAEAGAFIKRLLTLNPKDRPTAAKALELPWLATP